MPNFQYEETVVLRVRAGHFSGKKCFSAPFTRGLLEVLTTKGKARHLLEAAACLFWLVSLPTTTKAQIADPQSTMDTTEYVVPVVVLDQEYVLVGGEMLPIDSFEYRLRQTLLTKPPQKESPVIDLTFAKEIPLNTALELRLTLKKSSLFKLRYTIDGRRDY